MIRRLIYALALVLGVGIWSLTAVALLMLLATGFVMPCCVLLVWLVGFGCFLVDLADKASS